ncbi:hypothetical protein ZWY2020_054434 [Hordeum vulgare]|nr:hypothetical protein ZWY2020_054434 [Hordeum vulgare]
MQPGNTRPADACTAAPPGHPIPTTAAESLAGGSPKLALSAWPARVGGKGRAVLARRAGRLDGADLVRRPPDQSFPEAKPAARAGDRPGLRGRNPCWLGDGASWAAGGREGLPDCRTDGRRAAGGGCEWGVAEGRKVLESRGRRRDEV